MKQPRLRTMFILQLAWLGILCVLSAWWGYVMWRQAQRIAELEALAGIATDIANHQWAKTQRMLFWESATFIALLLLVSGGLIWYYWRDVRRSRSLEAFFASVTHELKTPLTSIRLQSESIADGVAADSPQRNLARRLLEDTSRLESQVERTLELARVEGGGALFNQVFRVRPWLDRLVQGWREMYTDSIRLEVDVDDCHLYADPNALQIVLKNLVENSIRHSGRSPVLVQIRVKQSNGLVKIHFEDDGVGIGAEGAELGKLFHKGAQSQGAGVGLYLSKNLVEKMKGKISFERRRANTRADAAGHRGFQADISLHNGESHG
ncbi:MAG: sensor histidine kinase [Bacteriovoracia bacterium]